MSEKNLDPRTTIVGELETILGNRFRQFFPEGVDGQVEKETFQSPAFKKAGYHHLTDRYGKGDRFLYTIKHPDGKITFVTGGKISSGNPYELGAASAELLDLRQQHVLICQFDGRETLLETQPNGETNSYTGEFGNPNRYLGFLKPRLGEKVE